MAFARSGTEVTADAGTPILDAAEEAGVLMPSGCRMGICFGCVLPLRSGSVRDLRNGEITTATEGETANGGIRIQTCINAAAGVILLQTFRGIGLDGHRESERASERGSARHVDSSEGEQ